MTHDMTQNNYQFTKIPKSFFCLIGFYKPNFVLYALACHPLFERVLSPFSPPPMDI